MADMVRLVATERERELWDDYVGALVGASFCHLSSWKEIIENAYGHSSYYLYCEQESAIAGVLPLTHVRGLLAPNRLVSVPFLDQGGILASNSEARSMLLDAALNLARKVGAKGVDLRNSSPGVEIPACQGRRCRFVVPLPASSEELWKTLGSKVRNQIRKAEKSGLETRIASPGELSLFFEVFSRNMRDLGSPTHSERFFRLIADEFDERFMLFLTRAGDGTVVAGAIAIRFANTITVPWASSLRSARAQCPNHSFYWKILEDAIEARASEFDFGRSTENSGTYFFKKQWATVLRPLGWRFLNWDGSAEPDYLLEAGKNTLLPRGWRSLPLPLANAIGPWIRSQLPN